MDEPVKHQTFFKGPRVTEKTRRRRKRDARDKRERINKKAVRWRDNRCTRRGCRFPLCGCKRFNHHLEVSHLQHKGMGSNPKEDRSAIDKMIQVCNRRHKDNRISIDKGTLECRPLTAGGTNGPVSWWVSVEDLMNPNVEIDWVSAADLMNPELILVDGWLEIAREIEPGVLYALTPLQLEILDFLAAMEF